MDKVYRAWVEDADGRTVFCTLHRSRGGAIDSVVGELERRHERVLGTFGDWEEWYSRECILDGRDFGVETVVVFD